MKRQLLIATILGFWMAAFQAWGEDPTPTPPLNSRKNPLPQKTVYQSKAYRLNDDSKKKPEKKARFFPLPKNTQETTPQAVLKSKDGRPVTFWAPTQRKSYHSLFQDSSK